MNYMHAPGPGDRHDTQGDVNAERDMHAEQLATDYWQDLEMLSDAFGDVAATEGYYRSASWSNNQPLHHPNTVKFLTLIRDGSDDLEAMKIIRASMRRYIAQMVEDQVGDEA